jgi:hypothetical protein
MVFNQGPHHTAAQKDLLSRTKPHCRSCPSELWARDNRTHGRAFAWRSSKIHETKQTQGSRAKSSFRRSPPSEATTRDKKSPSQSLALLTFPSASAVASRCEQPRTLMASRWVRPEVRATLSLSLSLSRFAYGWSFCRAGVPAVRSDGRGRRHLRDAAVPEHHRQPRSQVRIYHHPL